MGRAFDQARLKLGFRVVQLVESLVRHPVARLARCTGPARAGQYVDAAVGDYSLSL